MSTIQTRFQEKIAQARALPTVQERVSHLCFLANSHARLRGVDVLAVCREALSESEREGYEEGILKSRRAMARCYAEQGRRDESLEVLHDILSIHEEHNDALQIADTLTMMGSACEYVGEFEEALDYFLRAAKISEYIDNPELRANILNNIGLTHSKLGDVRQGLVYQTEALSYAKRINAPKLTCRLYTSNGIARVKIRDYTGALECFNESWRLAKNHDVDVVQVRNMTSIGEINLILGNSANALDWFHRGLQLAEHINDPLSIAYLKTAIGKINAQMGNHVGALRNLAEALQLSESANDPYGRSVTIHLIAESMFAGGDKQAALNYCDQNLELCRDTPNAESKCKTLFLMGRMAASEGLWEQAQTFCTDALTAAQTLDPAEWLLDIYDELHNIYRELDDRQGRKDCIEQQQALREELHNENERNKTKKAMIEWDLQALQQKSSGKQSGGFSLADDIRQKIAQFAHKTAAAPSIAPQMEAETGNGRMVSVHTLGRFAVCIDSREIKPEDWKRKKARDIFKVLLTHHRQSVTGEQLITALWGGHDPGKNLTPSLWNAVSYVRKALEPGLRPHTPSSFITIVDKAYILDLGEHAEIDFIEFRKSMDNALSVVDPSQRMPMLAAALHLYQGDFLAEDQTEEWAEHIRISLKELFINGSLSLANDYADEGDIAHALASARRILEVERTSEEAYRFILETLVDTHQPVEARKTLRECEEAFHRAGETPPADFRTIVTTA